MDLVIRESIKKLIKSMGYEFVGCEELAQGGKTVCRIYADKADGISLDDCAKISHQVGALLDVEDPFAGRFALEVSSPGIDRPLFELDQYQQFIGREIKIQLHAPIADRRKYTGTLVQVDNDSVYLSVAEGSQKVELPFAAIKKANLIGE